MSTIFPSSPCDLVLTGTPPRENSQTDPTTHSSFGRSVHDLTEIKIIALSKGDKELTQSELNQKHPQALEWQSHCQFYADCAHCQRFTLQPGSSTKAPKPHADAESADLNESCQRIKLAEPDSHQSKIARHLSKAN